MSEHHHEHSHAQGHDHEHEHEVDHVGIPLLLRWARGSYSAGVRRRLGELGMDDIPRNAPFILAGLATTEMSLSDLGDQLGSSKQAVSQLVETLVLRGYLSRGEVPGDRRRISIQLTERGRQAGTAVAQGVDDVNSLLGAALAPEELVAMKSGLLALARIGHRLEHADAPVPRPQPAGDRPNGIPALVEAMARRAFERTSVDRLGAHLAERYDVTVTTLAQLDVGVFRASLGGGGDWVARVFPAGRPLAWAEGDAGILADLAAHGYPAERPAVDNPVSVLDDQAVLVTEFVEPVARQGRREAIRAAGGWDRVGEMLALLHGSGLSAGPASRPGGGWHHLVDGGPGTEVEAAIALLGAAREEAEDGAHQVFDRLAEELGSCGTGAGLPQALSHPDFVLANIVAAKEEGLVVVDWTGAGQAPRAWSLAFLLWSAGVMDMARVDRAVGGYRRHVRLEPDEVDALPGLLKARPLVLAAWELALGRRPWAEVAHHMAEVADLSQAVAARALDALRA
jgi:DNA-binding MarR family transcriptional regulator/Ser/Thr protein kinase RdoA (MazF antagonist)